MVVRAWCLRLGLCVVSALLVGLMEWACSRHVDPSTPLLEPSPTVSSSQPDGEVTLLPEKGKGCVWVRATGSFRQGEHVTPAQARAQAIEKARARASERVTGVEIKNEFNLYQRESMGKSQQLVQDLLKSTVRGRIVQESVISHGSVSSQGCPGCFYRATIHACVAPFPKSQDLGFKASVQLEKDSFRHGELVKAMVRSSRDGVVYIYSVDKDGEARLALPNPFNSANAIKANVPFLFPGGPRAEQMVAEILGDDPESLEQIRVVVSKHPLPPAVYRPEMEGEVKAEGTETGEMQGGGSFLRLQKKLIDSGEEWVDAFQVFLIYKKQM